MENTGQKLFGGVSGTGGKANIDIDAPQALGITNGGAGVVVAVIDDGIDFSHPDLAAQAWTNPGESGGGKETNGIDDDGNGYVDDVHGWDFCHNDNTVHDFNDDFHGTHVAGTIAASLDGQGVVGRGPGGQAHGPQVHRRRRRAAASIRRRSRRSPTPSTSASTSPTARGAAAVRLNSAPS